MIEDAGRSRLPNDKVSLGGIDMASAYAADSYLGSSKVVDPWGEQCFLNVVDCFTDHPQLLLPQATHFSIEHTGSTILPEIVRSLLREKAISLHSHRVAEDLVPGDDTLVAAFREFRLFAIEHRQLLGGWLDFQRKSNIREHHTVHVPSGVQGFVDEFWRSVPQTDQLSQEMAIRSADLMYAFDAFYRGQQYDEILSSSNAIYFNHPMRSSLFSQRVQLHVRERKHYSWGRVLSQLISTRRVSARVDEIVDVMVRIRTEVGYNDATSDKLLNLANPSEVNERLTAVAARVGLPATLTSGVQKAAEVLAASVGAVLDTFWTKGPWATIVLTSAAATLGLEGRYIPGAAGTLKVLRGAMVWPGLFESRLDGR
jgi:hypothetical protein